MEFRSSPKPVPVNGVQLTSAPLPLLVPRTRQKSAFLSPVLSTHARPVRCPQSVRFEENVVVKSPPLDSVQATCWLSGAPVSRQKSALPSPLTSAHRRPAG